MDHLWSPWRYRYATRTALENAGACVFCEKQRSPLDEENLIIYRARANFVVVNLYPYTSGHIMIVPYAHVASLEECAEETATEMMTLARRGEAIIRRIYRAPGMNIGFNIGEAAGAGVAGHLHMHLVPRWAGDANFLTTIGETRVLPEDLHETWSRLREAFSGHALP
jgi:ATP adenylyltransferase